MKTKTMTTLHLKTLISGSPLRFARLLISLTFACFALCPMAQAVSPAPDGAYPGGNTAEGGNAMFSLTTGQFNTQSVSFHSRAIGEATSIRAWVLARYVTIRPAIKTQPLGLMLFTTTQPG